MKKILVLLSGLAVAGSVAAASINTDEAKDPHHAFGGCDSKAKSAQWHQFHNFDKSAESADAIEKDAEDTNTATSVVPKKRLSLEHYI